jgi:hypothetical protein
MEVKNPLSGVRVARVVVKWRSPTRRVIGLLDLISIPPGEEGGEGSGAGAKSWSCSGCDKGGRVSARLI